MALFALAILIQVLLVIHVVKTERNRLWLLIIALLPIAGSIAYFMLEIVPDISASRQGKQASRHISQIFNPNKELNRAASDYFIADSVENSKNLAHQFLKKEMYKEAQHLYKNCLQGLYENDPDMMYGLAQCEFGMKNYQQCKATLDALIEHNRDYKNQKAHLLYAKTLELIEELEQAIHEYEVLETYYNGPEPAYRLAMLLKRQGQEQKATHLLEKIIQHASVSGRHYFRVHKNWIKLAKNAL